jgi:PAS domain-containing protein
VARLLASGARASPTGGWVLLGAEGTVLSAGRVELVGEPLIPADVLADLPAGQSRSMVTADGQVVVATPIPGFLAGTGYLAYAVPADDLFSDLRAGGDQRNLALGFVVGAAVIGLALMNLRRERAVRRSEGRLDALLQNAHDIIVVLGADGRVRFASAALERQVGVAAEGATGLAL